MRRISIHDLTDAEKVREAMAEYDRDPEGFLARRRFKKANKYFLVHDGRQYDSKAIAGRAYELEHDVVVYSDQFSGGAKTVAKVLEGLGFTVTRPEPRPSRVDEMILDHARASAARAEIASRLAASWGVELAPDGGYRRRVEPAASEEPEPITTPDALLAQHAGPRSVARRTAAQPRVEDPELYDRANDAHEELRSKLVAFLESRGFTVHDPTDAARALNVDLDLAATHGDLRLIVEVKSMPVDASAEAARLRSGLGQVLWYRRRFFAVCRERRVAVLAVARQPRDHEDWVATCRDANVVLTWPEQLEWLVEACRCAQAR